MTDQNQVSEQRARHRQYQHVDERQRIESALGSIDPHDREIWVSVGQAIQDELVEDGFSLWNEWSQRADNYDERAARDVWRSFDQDSGRTIATLFKLARENGWADNMKPIPMTQEEAEARKCSREKAASLSAEAKAKRHANRAVVARQIYDAALPDGVPEHAYAARKGGLSELRVRRGRYLDHDCLIVPLYGEDGQIWTIQAIADGPVFDGNRDKTLLAGARKAGCYFPIGPEFRGASRVCIAEGLATAKAVHESVDLPVIMAVDAGNMLSVGQIVRRLAAPGAEIVFCADDDQSPGTEQNPGMKAAQKAAQAVGGVVATPAMGKKADFWDVWAELGAGAVQERIEVALRPEARKRRFIFATRDEIVERPFPKWTIKGVMPEKGVGAMHGPSTVGKSFLAVDMAAHIAEGRNWFGYRTKQRPVAYFVFEGRSGFSTRVLAWEQFNGRKFPKNVAEITVSADGDPAKACFDLRKQEDVKDLCADILDAVGMGAVVIFDTLNQAAPGLEENSSVDYGLCLAACHTIERVVGGFTLLIGHPGKDEAKGFRGHSSLFAGLDLNIELKAVNKDKQRFLWTLRKVKDGKDQITHHFHREVVHLGVDEDGDDVTSCVIMPDMEADREGKGRLKTVTPRVAERFEAYRQAAIEHGTLDDAGEFIGLGLETWRSAFNKQNVNAKSDTTSKAFRRLKNGLVDSRWIKETPGGFLLPDGPGAEIQLANIRAAIAERSRTSGQCPDKSRTSPMPELCTDSDGPDIPPLGGCPAVRPGVRL